VINKKGRCTRNVGAQGAEEAANGTQNFVCMCIVCRLEELG